MQRVLGAENDESTGHGHGMISTSGAGTGSRVSAESQQRQQNCAGGLTVLVLQFWWCESRELQCSTVPEQ